MELIKPCADYQTSYLSYIEELGREERYPFVLDFDHTDFNAMLAKVNDFATGVNIPEGYVQSTTLWLVDQDELIGVTNLRHHLNKAIEHCGGHIGLGVRPSRRGEGLGLYLMQRSISKLQEMGVNTVHIHCYKDNPASAKTIIGNSGVLHSELTLEGEGKIVQRYIVESKSSF